MLTTNLDRYNETEAYQHALRLSEERRERFGEVRDEELPMQITGVRLDRIGNDAVVFVEIDTDKHCGVWVEVLREPFDDNFASCVGESELKKAIENAA